MHVCDIANLPANRGRCCWNSIPGVNLWPEPPTGHHTKITCAMVNHLTASSAGRLSLIHSHRDLYTLWKDSHGGIDHQIAHLPTKNLDGTSTAWLTSWNLINYELWDLGWGGSMFQHVFFFFFLGAEPFILLCFLFSRSLCCRKVRTSSLLWLQLRNQA